MAGSGGTGDGAGRVVLRKAWRDDTVTDVLVARAGDVDPTVRYWAA